MKTVPNKAALTAVISVITFCGAGVFAQDGVTERAVPAPSTQLQQASPLGGKTIPTLTVDQQLAALQQQVQSLQAQMAALQSVLKVTPTSATLQAPSVSIFSAEGTTIQSSKGITVKAATGIVVQSQAGTSIKAGSTATIEASGTTELKGAMVRLNGGSKPIAMVGSAVGNGQVMTGSTTILGN